MSKRPAMLASLRARYEADIAEADTTINIYLDHPGNRRTPTTLGRDR